MESRCAILVLGLLAACLVQASELPTIDHWSHVSKECKSKLTSITTLAGFKQFMVHYRAVIEGQEYEAKREAASNKDRSLQKCFDQSEQLFELERIILGQDSNNGVCLCKHTRELVDYHKKYVVKTMQASCKRGSLEKSSSKSTVRRTYAAYIFSLYAHQVVYTCKNKLLERATILNRIVNCYEVLHLTMPMRVGQLRDQKRHDDANKLLLEFLDKFENVEDFSLMFDEGFFEPIYELPVTEQAAEKIEKLQRLCKEREPYFRALFLPIATLAQYGYEVTESSVDKLDLNDSSSIKLKGWLAAAQLCQGASRVHVNIINEDDNNDDDDDNNNNNNNNDDDHDEDSSVRFFPRPMFEIKFKDDPSLPVANAEDTNHAQDNSLPELKFVDSIQELEPSIVKLVHKKKSLVTRFKRNFSWIKKLVADNTKIDDNHSEVARYFNDAIRRGEKEFDAHAAFCGDQDEYRNMVGSPGRMVANDADASLAIGGLFTSHKISLILNTLYAVCFGAAWLFYTIYLPISGTVHLHLSAEDSKEFARNQKQVYKQMMLDRRTALRKSAERRGKSKFFAGSVYTGTQIM